MFIVFDMLNCSLTFMSKRRYWFWSILGKKLLVVQGQDIRNIMLHTKSCWCVSFDVPFSHIDSSLHSWTICCSFHYESLNKHGFSISLPIFCCSSTPNYHNVACLVCVSKWITLYQRAGAVFPPRSERSTPLFTPPQTQPLSSYPQNLRNIEYPQGAAESPAESEFPTLRYVLNIQLLLGYLEHELVVHSA